MPDQGQAPFVVRARGEIDLDAAPRLRRELTRALDAHREVLLDLSQVTDCSGLGALVQARNQADRTGGRRVLRGVGHPARLLRLTGLTGRLGPTF
ncbi:STAS domain-containing protein [Kitasatospora sp. NPDC001175]|uniref:STAS domain-containing protein n=1 Tax=Kitasatospora sp. NPDC001175 TaxID=3157103 RepID=UPI003D02BF74